MREDATLSSQQSRSMAMCLVSFLRHMATSAPRHSQGVFYMSLTSIPTPVGWMGFMRVYLLAGILTSAMRQNS